MDSLLLFPKSKKCPGAGGAGGGKITAQHLFETLGFASTPVKNMIHIRLDQCPIQVNPTGSFEDGDERHQ